MNSEHILFAVVAVLAVYIIGKILALPIKLAGKRLINAASGLVMLMIVNFIGSYIGYTVEINWLNCILVGIFGIPGVALLFVMQWAGIVLAASFPFFI